MSDLYNKEQRADSIQQMKSRVHLLRDCECDLRQQLNDVINERKLLEEQISLKEMLTKSQASNKMTLDEFLKEL